MYLMMQHKNPDVWVIATGETHTVREFLEVAFNVVGLDYEKHIEISEKYYRPNEVDYLLETLPRLKRTQMGAKNEF